MPRPGWSAPSALENGFTDEVLADGDEEMTDEACKCSGVCGAECTHDGMQCSTECSCDCTYKMKADDDGDEAQASAHPVLARYKNTPQAIRDRVTTRAAVEDVTRRLQLRRTSPHTK
jgi:hypothetical protein